jgi:N-formylglutamate amidohydrolase
MTSLPDDADARVLKTSEGGREAASCSVVAPAEQTLPLVFASPHSGRDYPRAFVAASRLDPLSLRRSEDAFIDQVFGAAPAHGAPLLRAHFPRVYVDPNREPYELDPEMFDGPLPGFVNVGSPRVAAGLGTVARVVTSGEEVYAGKLEFDEVHRRIQTHYFPYHAALKDLIETTRDRFGGCLLIDCHSMPSVGGPMDSDPGLKRVDMVLGDRFCTSCAPSVTDFVERTLGKMGYSVRRNLPYAGGYTTAHYGRPREGVHALQIELNRALYMDEDAVAPTEGFERLARNIGDMIAALSELEPRRLRAI